MKKTKFIIILLAAVLVFSFDHGADAAALKAQINNDKVALGDRFELTLTTDAAEGAMPDLTPLRKNFSILGTSSSMQTQIINGRQSRKTSWIITLSPKQKGKMTIPELSLAGSKSQPLTVDILDQSTMPKSQGVEGIEIQSSIPTGKYYIYQEIPLVVRVETPFPLTSAQLIAPNDPAYELIRDGEDRKDQILRNGQPITVIERQYTLRPQSSGEITIAPFALSGEVKDPNARQNTLDRMGFSGSIMRDFPFSKNLFDNMFSPVKPFSARTEAIKLSVKSGANITEGDWFLPAKAVKLVSEWQSSNPVFRVGEAVTRKISIFALGARPEQLPDIIFASSSNAHIYVDSDSTEEFKTPEGTVSKREIVTSVVPTTAGEVTLPEITVKWWDTDAGEEKIARIAAESILVEGPVTAAVHNPDTTGSSIVAKKEPMPNNGAYKLLDWFVAVGSAIVILASIFGVVFVTRKRWILKAGQNKLIQTGPDRNRIALRDLDDALKVLKSACNGQDAREIYDAALTWRRAMEKQAFIPNRFQVEIHRLENFLYSGPQQAQKWESRKIMKIAKNAQRGLRKTEKVGDILPRLYPAASETVTP